jgi:hypothetical protein
MIQKLWLLIAKIVSFPDNLIDIHDDEENAIIDE